MGKTSYGPRTLRAWRGADKKRTLARVGAAIGRSGQTILNYERGAVPCERERRLLSILCDDKRMRSEEAWFSTKEILALDAKEESETKRVLAARAEMGGGA